MRGGAGDCGQCVQAQLASCHLSSSGRGTVPCSPRHVQLAAHQYMGPQVDSGPLLKVVGAHAQA